MQHIKDELYAVFIPPVDNHRFLLCLNTSKREDDRKYRNQCIESIKNELDKLNSSLGKNKNLKTRDEVMRKAGVISKLNSAGKYFEISTVDSTQNTLSFELKYKIKEEKLKDDERLDGTFVIQTNQEDYVDEKLIKIYKNLSKVENAFKIIKNDLDIRPIYHRKEDRVKGHVYLCVIAYFIITAIEYIAKEAKHHISARKILRQLSKINLLEINLPDGKRKYSLTTVDREQKSLLNIYKIKKLEVPV